MKPAALVPERSQGAFASTMANDHDQDPEVQCAARVFRILPRPYAWHALICLANLDKPASRNTLRSLTIVQDSRSSDVSLVSVTFWPATPVPNRYPSCPHVP